MKESIAEADFCSSMTPYGGAFGVEVTHDVDRHIAVRIVMWSYRHDVKRLGSFFSSSR